MYSLYTPCVCVCVCVCANAIFLSTDNWRLCDGRHAIVVVVVGGKKRIISSQ